ncbi:MAG: hypothetical protein RL417_2166 [Pseudomonadota bacterium]
MRWAGRRQSDNIIDQRNSSFRPRAGKKSIGTLLIMGLAMYAMGGDPQMIVSMLGGEIMNAAVAPKQSTAPRSAYDSDDSMGLVSVTLADLEDRWTKIFAQDGRRYVPTPLVLFRGGTQTACGMGQTATGPFYCPADKKVYLDLSFMDDLNRLGGKGDFALAYVVAHEVGHHVQNLLYPGKMGRRQGQRESIATELQADCFAGIWAHFANQERDFLEQGDIEEGLRTAAAVGDDHIQRSAGRAVSPESFSHGTSEQRVAAFRRGFESGALTSCNF